MLYIFVNDVKQLDSAAPEILKRQLLKLSSIKTLRLESPEGFHYPMILCKFLVKFDTTYIRTHTNVKYVAIKQKQTADLNLNKSSFW